jgi:hypothetical protein
MATSITQAKPLLTAAELELFDHSRAEPIKALSAKQLAGKEKRTRSLRDKYRDLYRRQSVAAQGKTKGVGETGDANARTQRKAEIMQEVLDRFEARSSLLGARESRADEAKEAKSKKPARKAAASVVPTSASDKPASRAKKSADASKQRSESAPAHAFASTTASRKASASATATAKPSKTRLSKTKNGQFHAPEQALSAVGSLNQAEDGSALPEHFIGVDPTVRSPKAPSPRAPTFGGKAHAPEVNAPLDMVASAQRMNPVKNSPSSQAIQGHVSSSVRRSQGKRDSR